MEDEIKKHPTYKKLVEFFGGDEEKAMEWYYKPNPNLPGHMSPALMIEEGMSDELTKWVFDCLSGYQW